MTKTKGKPKRYDDDHPRRGPSPATERTILSLSPTSPEIVLFREAFEEMSPKGKEQVIAWLNAFLNGSPCKNMGVAGAIELLMKSLKLEEGSIRLLSPREEIQVRRALRSRRGLTPTKL
jgi:hypothetical protein